jgi:transposase
VLLNSAVFPRNARVVTTNPLDFIWSIRGIAVCICHVAIGARMRSNVIDWTPEELWHAYVQLTEAEAAFRVHKSDLQIRPVWHHREHRVGAHILVCFWRMCCGRPNINGSCHRGSA